MKDIAICILTRSRFDRQTTLNSLPLKLRRFTYLVINKDEYLKHKKYDSKVKQILAMPKGWGNFDSNFSDKKQWTAENIKERYYIILDDDLTFNIRTTEGRLIKAKRSQIHKGFQILYAWLESGIAHVGMSAREGNNRIEEDYIENARTMRVCGFDLKVIKNEGLMFNRTPLMADFDITLSLLERGYKNRILFKWANGQRKSNDDGGCSLYRTPELMKFSAKKLHSLHPQFITVKQKETAKPWGGFDNNIRTDVTMKWKKAYEFGKAKRSKSIKHFI